MVKFNPRNKGNKPGIAIMIAVKPPKKGKKIKKNLWEDIQDIEEMKRRGIDTSFMSRENPNQPPPKIPRKKPDSMDESARQGADANRQALAGTSVPSEEPDKKVNTKFPWFLMPENKEKAEAMEMAWRFLKSEKKNSAIDEMVRRIRLERAFNPNLQMHIGDDGRVANVTQLGMDVGKHPLTPDEVNRYGSGLSEEEMKRVQEGDY